MIEERKRGFFSIAYFLLSLSYAEHSHFGAILPPLALPVGQLTEKSNQDEQLKC